MTFTIARCDVNGIPFPTDKPNLKYQKRPRIKQKDKILKVLTKNPQSLATIAKKTEFPPSSVRRCLSELRVDGLVKKYGDPTERKYGLA